MKNKFKFLITGLMSVLIAGVFSFGIANASDSSIFVSPNNLDKNVGESFALNVIVDTAGSKVCAVEGTLQLDKLSCQSIVVGSGIMAQKSPTCADPSFLLGIPNCSINNETLLTVTVKAEQAGSAVVSFANVDVVGEGFSLSTSSTNGTYEITVVPDTPHAVTTPVPVIAPVGSCICEDWEDWKWNLNNDCGRGGCEATQLLQTRERTCNPISCEIEVENRCVADAYCASAILVDADSQTASALGAIGEMGLRGWLILGFILLILVILVYSYFGKKRR